MRKLFSILAVALLALSAHATVVTHNFDLSQFSNYGTATVSGGTITVDAAWNGAQIWFGDGESAFDASEYEVLVLELASASAVGVNFAIEYADETASNDITIDAGQTSAQLPLKSNKIKNIVIKLTDAGSATLSSLYFKGYAGKVSEEAVTINENDDNGYLGNWDKAVKVWSGSLSGLGLQVDDKLVIKYTLSGSDDQFQIKTISNNAFNFASTVNPESGTTSIAFTLNSADITLLITEGIYINGKNMTITGISVLKHAVLWTGTTEAGNWSGYQQIDASKLTNLQVGNIICVRVSAIGTEGSPRITLADGTWTALVDGEYYFQGGDEAPMDVEFPVTYKMAQQLRGKNLVVRGVNYTMTDIYVKEGTPTNTVAGYLNVTDAGMATLVLPFDVPTLPTGVQAYNLTNNGDETIWANEVNVLEADKPVLIVAAEGEYEFVSEEGASDDISSKTGTYANGALVGTYTAINPLAQTTGGNYNYVLNNQGGNVAFYQVRDDGCSVAPYRAYLSCGHDASNNGANFAPRMRIVFHKDTTTGVENVQGDKLQSTKVFENGVLYIMNNGIKYNVQGQLCK
ncbi:MAG: hypothetical protein IKO26_03510 [Paludibacteraceae bacterium]|nr:hypothetical protein [Paludibacteraceae bacterium]